MTLTRDEIDCSCGSNEGRLLGQYHVRWLGDKSKNGLYDAVRCLSCGEDTLVKAEVAFDVRGALEVAPVEEAA